LLFELCSQHLEAPKRRLERLEGGTCPMCLLEEVVRASDLVKRAAEKMRRLEQVVESARRFRAGAERSGERLDEALASLDRAEAKGKARAEPEPGEGRIPGP